MMFPLLSSLAKHREINLEVMPFKYFKPQICHVPAISSCPVNMHWVKDDNIMVEGKFVKKCSIINCRGWFDQKTSHEN